MKIAPTNKFHELLKSKFDKFNIQYLNHMNDFATLLYSFSQFRVLDKDNQLSIMLIKYILDNPELMEKGYNNLHTLLIALEPHSDTI